MMMRTTVRAFFPSAAILLTGIAYFACAVLGLWLAREANAMTVFWPANGVALGMLLHFRDIPRRSALAACGLAGGIAGLIFGKSPLLSGTLAVVDVLEIAGGLWASTNWNVNYLRFNRARDLAEGLRIGCVATAFGASMAAFALPHLLPLEALQVWIDWFAGHVVGMWLCVHLVLAVDPRTRTLLAREPHANRFRRVVVETLVVLLATLAVVAVAAFGKLNSPVVFIPILLWIGLRWGPTATSTSALLFSTALATSMAVGIWRPFGSGRPMTSSDGLELQLMLFCLSSLPLTISILVRECTQSRAELDRKNKENSLYRAMVQELPDCLSIKGLEGRFIVANTAAANFMGASSPETLLGRTDHDFLPAETADRYREDELAFLKGGETTVIEQTYALPDGTIGWLSSLKSLFHDEAGATVGIVTHSRDITLRKQLELELSNTRKQLDDAVASMPDGFALFGSNGQLVICNQRYRDMFPQTGDLRVPGSLFFETIRAAVRLGEYADGLNMDLEGFISERMALLHRAGHHEIALAGGRWIDACTRPTRDDGTIMVLRDITERKLLELNLRLAKAQVEDALDSMADGFAVFDHEDRMEMCNERYRHIFAKSADLRVPGVLKSAMVRASVMRGQYLGISEDNADDFVARALSFREGTSEYQLSEDVWLESTTRPTRRGGTVLVYRDVTERKLLEQRLHHQANHDSMTRLANRTMFRAELERSWTRIKRDGGRLAIMLIDLDFFKTVNDTHGHDVGDQLLVEVARRLETGVREGDVVGRLGGDEFAVLATSHVEGDGFIALAVRLLQRLGAPMLVRGIDLFPSASLGFVVFPDELVGTEELLLRADRALYAAKSAGRGTWARFSENMTQAKKDRHMVTDDVHASCDPLVA